MNFRKGVYKRNIDFDNVVRLNKTRSYRDGNLMYLNYEIIDRWEKLIFSIDLCLLNDVKEFDDYLIYIKNNIAKLNSIRYNMNIYNHMIVNRWFDRNKYKDGEINESLIEYILKGLVEQSYMIYRELDFYSLQTKEKFEIEKNKIRETSTKMISYIEDCLSSNDKDKHSLAIQLINVVLSKIEVFNIEDSYDKEHLSWLQENNVCCLLMYSVNHPEIFKLISNVCE